MLYCCSFDIQSGLSTMTSPTRTFPSGAMIGAYGVFWSNRWLMRQPPVPAGVRAGSTGVPVRCTAGAGSLYCGRPVRCTGGAGSWYCGWAGAGGGGVLLLRLAHQRTGRKHGRVGNDARYAWLGPATSGRDTRLRRRRRDAGLAGCGQADTRRP